MDSQKVALVRAAYDRVNNEDIAGLLELLDPDVEFPDVIHNTVLRGRESVERYWQDQILAAEHSAVPSEILELGEAVIVVAYHQIYERNGGPLGPGMSAVQRVTFRGDLIAKVEFTPLGEIPDHVRERLS